MRYSKPVPVFLKSENGAIAMKHECDFACSECKMFSVDKETGKHDCLLSVAVVVLPTGETLWMESEKYKPGYMRKVVDAWKEQHPGFDGSGCSMGVVEINMPLSLYKKIPATNSFDWPDV